MTDSRWQIRTLVAALASAMLLLLLAPAARGVQSEEPASGVDGAKSQVPEEALAPPRAAEPGFELPERKTQAPDAANSRASGDEDRLAAASSEEVGAPQERRVDEDLEGNPYVAGELVLTFESGVSAQAADSVERESNGRALQAFPKLGAEHL